MIVEILLMGFLLLFSAFFSGSETAIYSLNSLEKDLLRRRSTGGKGQFVHLLFQQPDEVLVTILTGNMFVNILSSSIAEAIGAEIFTEAAEILSIASMTAILLIVGEMTPKNIAIRHSLRFAHFTTYLLRYVHKGLWPISHPLGRIRHSVISLFPKHGRDIEADQAGAVLSAIRMGYQSKTIEESELRLLERFFRFRMKMAADVMVPRVDLHPVDASISVCELISLISSGALGPETSLIPIYKHDIDHLSGYVRRVDLVEQRFHNDSRRLSEIAKPIHAVPAGKRLRELLEEMTAKGTEMSIVVDQYGGTEGIVSYPGLVGYLFEDFMPRHTRAIEQIEDGSYRIEGHAEIDEVAAVLDVDLIGSGRTIAGMLLEEFGKFPEPGWEVEVSGYLFRITGVTDRRISLVEVRRLEK